MSTSAIQEIEQSIQKSRKLVEFGDAIERLRAQRDFKKVVVEGYLEQEAVRLVHLKADPSMQTAERQESINRQIDAIGQFMQFLNTSLQMASLAKKQIAADEEVRDELVAEELAQ